MTQNVLLMKNIWIFRSYKFTPEKKQKIKIIKIIKKFKTIYKDEKKIIKFDDTETEEYKLYQYKIPNSIKDIDITKVLASNKFPVGKKDLKEFIG